MNSTVLKFGNLEEHNPFVERYNLPKFTQEIDNFNRLIWMG